MIPLQWATEQTPKLEGLSEVTLYTDPPANSYKKKITFFQLEQRAVKWDNGPSSIGEPSVINS